MRSIALQTTAHILMIRPVHFGFNPQTAVNNAFQIKEADLRVQEKALLEFERFTALLQSAGVDVITASDTAEPHTPDSIFPNNWVSFHEDGTVCLYPMFAANRRQERNPLILEKIAKQFVIKKTIDFTPFEQNNLFLEGTGSMVLDRVDRVAYASFSPRTSRKLFQLFCEQMGFRGVGFHSQDQKGQPIYHTNVLMCLADKYMVICMDAVPAKEDRELIYANADNSGKELVEISYEQMNHFAGNMLQVHNKDIQSLLVMSTQAYQSLSAKQKKKLLAFNPIIHAPLDTIETNGGGSARCMMAEIHLPPVIGN